MSAEAVNDQQYISDWNQVIYPATLLLANITGDATFRYGTQRYLRKWLRTTDSPVTYSDLGRAINSNDPSLAQGMNSAFLGLLYEQLVED